MRVMVSNQSRAEFHFLAGRYPDRIGWLISPGGTRAPRWFSYALDNGAFPIWRRGGTWDASSYRRLLLWAERQPTAPLWVLVPDVVGSRDGTLRLWQEWAPRLRADYNWPLAFAVQDGMTPMDIPERAAVIFVGGSTHWKRRTLEMWCRTHPRVHVGRVNSVQFLWLCAEVGAESVDGTGWYHQNARQLYGLMDFCLDYQNGHRRDPDRTLPLLAEVL